MAEEDPSGMLDWLQIGAVTSLGAGDGSSRREDARYGLRL